VKELYLGTTSTVTGSLSVTIPASDSRIYRFSAASLNNSRLAIDSKIKDGNANLTWNESPNSNRYNLIIFKNGQVFLDTTVTSNEFSLTNYRNFSSDLKAKVKALGIGYEGEWSNETEIKDVISPTLKIKKTVTLDLNAEGKATLALNLLDKGTFDNDLLQEISLSKSEFTSSDLGKNTIMITARDFSGNESSSEVIVLVEDKIKPSISSIKEITIQLDYKGRATLNWEDIDQGSTDNGEIIERVLSKTEFTRRDTGENSITYTIKDSSGNTSSSVVKVKVDATLSTSPFGKEIAPRITLYPNPAKNSVLVESEGSIFQNLTSIEIIDASGKKLNPAGIKNYSGKSLFIDTSDLSNGIYFIRIITDKTVRNLKFIIEK
jgi:hypothetical protein